MKHINVAVIGIGNMGSAHAACIAQNQIEGMSLTAVCDIADKKLTAFSEKYPNIKCYKSYEQLFNDKICDSVIIAVPHPLHAEIAIKAFEHGLNVMLEKPADISVSKAKRLNEAAKKSGKVFSIMFNQRTNPLFAKAREIVQSGGLGELKRTVWIITNWFRTQSYYDSGGWRATWSGEGGGVLLNQAPHNLDLWQWICGMPSKVRAFCHEGKWHDVEIEDDVTIYAEYPNGATGVFVTSTGDFPGSNRLEITMDRAKIVCEKGEKITLFELSESLKENIPNCENGFASIPCKEIEVETDEINDQHPGVLNAFSDHILYGTPLVAEGKEGINGLMISNAAHLSSWTNETVTLPIDEDKFYALLMEKAASSKAKENVISKVTEDMSSTF